MTRTFWLCQGGVMLTAVRMPADATDQEIILHAIENEEKCPTGHFIRREAPFEFKNRLHRAVVRIYEDGPTADEAPKRHKRVPAADLGDTLDASRYVDTGDAKADAHADLCRKYETRNQECIDAQKERDELRRALREIAGVLDDAEGMFRRIKTLVSWEVDVMLRRLQAARAKAVEA